VTDRAIVTQLYLNQLEYIKMFDTNTMIKIGAGVVGGLVAITGSYFLGRHNGYKKVTKGQQEKAPEAPAPEAKAK
jgi:hypothetical protein